jgi:cyclic-di-GMP-binding protein
MASTPSLDIVSRIDFAELDNAINNAKKAVTARFDFKNCRAEIEVDKKEKKLKLLTEDGKMNALKEMVLHAAVKRGLSMKSIEFGETEPGASGGTKCEAKLHHGLDQETAKEIVKLVKDTKLKVQASIQGEEVRLSGKQIDDLRTVMTMLQKAELKVPLQFVNMKS